MTEEKKICFKDLNGWLKTLVVFGWISVGYILVAFIVGFTIGMLTPI